MTFDKLIGMEPVPDAADSARIRIEPHHCNPTGNVNGGVIISLADNLATGAANRAFAAKTGQQAFMVGVDLHAVMLGNQQGGTLTATARVVRVGRRITVIRTQVHGEGERLLAEITTTHVPT